MNSGIFHTLIALVIISLMSAACKKKDTVVELQIIESNCNCSALEAPGSDQNVITVSTITELYTALDEAVGPTTIYLQNGVYEVSSSRFIYVTKDNITIRSESGNRDDVTIRGAGISAGGNGHGILVSASNFTVADLTIEHVQNHGVQIQGENNSDNPLIHNIRFADINEQMVKVSKGNTGENSDNGIVECCLFEFTQGQANQYYTGGIDGHTCKNWIVRNNTFKNIKSPESALCEHAVHFWSASENTVVENNLIINCDRGIGFGLGESTHIGGIIRNNMVHTSTDVGIMLESASNVKVYNNTVHTVNYNNSIEYRFSGTINAHIVNNLVNGEIAKRNDGSATLETNFRYSDFSIFVSSNSYNYKLASSVYEIVDQGTTLSDVTKDFECDVRPKGSYHDIGADEFQL